MSFQPQSEEQAVFFFDGDALERQMLWLEFEAVLDGFVPLPEEAGQTVQAVFLNIVPGPHITSAVFFLIRFDKNGYADRSWNIPLDQFARNSPTGPDLGAGAIRLACRSQCSISWFRDQLWDPDLQGESNHLSILKQAVAANRLQLRFATAKSSSKDRLSSKGEEGQPAATGTAGREADTDTRELQLLQATLRERHHQEIDSLKREHQQLLAARDRQLEHANQQAARQESRACELESVVDSLQEKILGLREYFEHKFDRIRSGDEAAVEALRQQLEVEKEIAVREAVTSLRDQLQIRDIELMYRDTRMQGLQQEVDKLVAERGALLENSGNQMLRRLNDKGISFVTFQPGAGQITVPPDELAHYLSDKSAFVAARCGVDKAAYEQWLTHFKRPVCTRELVAGKICGKGLNRIQHPSDFRAGISDYCDDHQPREVPLSEAASS